MKGYLQRIGQGSLAFWRRMRERQRARARLQTSLFRDTAEREASPPQLGDDAVSVPLRWLPRHFSNHGLLCSGTIFIPILGFGNWENNATGGAI